MKKYFIFKVVCSCTMIFLIAGCTPKSSRMQEYKLMRYQQIAELEGNIKQVSNLVPLEQNKSINNLIRSKYSRDLVKLYQKIKTQFSDSGQVRGKLSKLLKEKKKSPYVGERSDLNKNILLGMGIENSGYKSSFLQSLKGSQIQLNGRVIDLNINNKKGYVSFRVPLTKTMIKTEKIVIVYVLARSKKLRELNELRRYHDGHFSLELKKASFKESNNFVIVNLAGTLKNAKVKGWLGLTSWKKEPSFLPTPTEWVKKKKKKRRSYTRRSRSSSSSASSTATTQSSNTTSRATSTGATTAQPAENTNLENSYNDDSDDF